MSFLARVMVSSQKCVPPCACTLQDTVLEDHRPFQHAFLFPVGFEPFVSSPPNAVFLADLAFSLACTAAGAITLVFHALGLGTKKSDFRQRTIAAITTVEHYRFNGVFRTVHCVLYANTGLLDTSENYLSGFEAKCPFFKSCSVQSTVYFVAERDFAF